jgi:hypothetical protein
MAKVKIQKRDGSPTNYCWSSTDAGAPTRVAVFKQTANGLRRMRGVTFNTLTNCMRRQKEA